MRKALFLPLAILFSCNQSAEKATVAPPTDYHAVNPEKRESDEQNGYITYEADTSNLTPEPLIPIKLLLEGTFHKQEVWKGADKKEWLGVFNENGRFYLKRTKLSIIPAFDPVLDAGKEINGKRILSGREVVSQDSNAVFFLIGLPKYTEGIIDSVAFTRSIIPANKQLRYSFKGKHYSIRATGDSTLNSEGQYNYRNYSWKVTGVKRGKLIEQKLAENEQFDDSIYVLLWAGDIDRDGIPDLLIDTSNHYNISTIALFLSSKADKGKLYKKVAIFETIGC